MSPPSEHYNPIRMSWWWGLLAVSMGLLAMPPQARSLDKDSGEVRAVIAAFPRNFPPHCFIDDQGQPAGFAIDVLDQVAGLANLKVIYKPEATFGDAVNSLNSGAADLIPNSGITSERLQAFDCTIPVETFDVVLFVRKGDALLARLNPAIETLLRSADYQRTYSKWYGGPYPFWTSARGAAVMVAVGAGILLAMFVWRYRSIAALHILLQKEADGRKQAEDELRLHRDHLAEVVADRPMGLSEREERFRSLSESAFKGIIAASQAQLKESQRLAHIGSWTLNLQTNFLVWSDEVYRIFEIAQEDFAGSYEAFLDAIHPEDRELVNLAYTGALASGTPYSVEHRLLMKDGRIKYVIETGKSFFDRDGTPLRSVGTVQDITDHRIIELALQRLNEELEQRVAQRTLELRAAGLDLENTQRALINIVEDLNEKTTELENANDKLQGLDRLKSMFIATMSHELRTPLNSIIGFSSILLDEWVGPLNAEQKTKLAIVLRTGRHLLTLINDVIDVSKIEAGKMDTFIETFDLGNLVSEALELVAKEIRDKGLSLEVEVDPLNLTTDRRRLYQCLVNLLSNAVKFTDHGKITIKTALLLGRVAGSGSDRLQITVSDTGIGIAADDLPRLFTPFCRIDSPLRLQVKGTGLGLYLVKKITEEILQGEVGMESRPGKGSSFFIKISLVAKTGEGNDENRSGG